MEGGLPTRKSREGCGEAKIRLSVVGSWLIRRASIALPECQGGNFVVVVVQIQDGSVKDPQLRAQVATSLLEFQNSGPVYLVCLCSRLWVQVIAGFDVVEREVTLLMPLEPRSGSWFGSMGVSGLLKDPRGTWLLLVR